MNSHHNKKTDFLRNRLILPKFDENRLKFFRIETTCHQKSIQFIDKKRVFGS
jgi:hypothetical protein